MPRPNSFGRAGGAALRNGNCVCVALVLVVAALVGALAWALMLPAGRGVLDVACVVERAAGQQGERRTEVVCVEALGRTRLRLDFGAAEAVVPFYHGDEEAGGGGAVVVERDALGRWAVECEMTRRTRRCFAAWWPWRDVAAADASAAGDDAAVSGSRFDTAGQPPAWGEGHRALGQWQAGRVGAAQLYGVRRVEAWRPAVAATRIVEQRLLAAQVWTRAGH